MQTPIVFLNLVVSLGSAIAGVLALFRPTALLGATGADPGDSFYVRLYSARAIPIGIGAGILGFLLHGPGVASLLFVAAAIQFGDVCVGALRRNARMAIAASIAGIIHLACGAAVF